MEGYGGIWLTGKPFEFNTKCLVISIAAAGIYMLPRFSAAGNVAMIAFIMVIVYIMISIYDYLYNCDARMYSRGISATGIFKPQYRDTKAPEGVKLAADQERMYLRSVYVVHAAIIAPILIYAGVKKDVGMLPVVAGLGALAGFYHTIRIFYPRQTISCS